MVNKVKAYSSNVTNNVINVEVETLIPSDPSVPSVPSSPVSVFVAEELSSSVAAVVVVDVVAVVSLLDLAELLYSACFLYFSQCQRGERRGGGTPATH